MRSSCCRRTPRLSSISCRQSETFARYGRNAAHTGSRQWSHRHLEISSSKKERYLMSKAQLCGNRCKVWQTRLPQILSRRGESASSQLAIIATLGITSTTSAKTTCSKTVLQNQRMYNTRDLSNDNPSGERTSTLMKEFIIDGLLI